jgi:hypothetical protein
VVDGQTALGHHLFQIPVAERVSQIPSHAENDHHVLEVSTTEQCRPILAHRVTVPDRRLGFATEPGILLKLKKIPEPAVILLAAGPGSSAIIPHGGDLDDKTNYIKCRLNTK